MIMYRIQSGRTQPLWLTTLYSILTLVAVGVIFWFVLPFIIALVAILVVAGVIGYWWLRWKLKKMAKTQQSNFSREDEEYVDFEVIDDK